MRTCIKVVILTCLILSEEGLRYPEGMELRWSVTASAGNTLLTSVYSDRNHCGVQNIHTVNP